MYSGILSFSLAAVLGAAMLVNHGSVMNKQGVQQNLSGSFFGKSCQIVYKIPDLPGSEIGSQDRRMKHAVFSPQGDSYAMTKLPSYMLVKDGKEYPQYTGITFLGYSIDGKNFAFVSHGKVYKNFQQINDIGQQTEIPRNYHAFDVDGNFYYSTMQPFDVNNHLNSQEGLFEYMLYKNAENLGVYTGQSIEMINSYQGIIKSFDSTEYTYRKQVAVAIKSYIPSRSLDHYIIDGIPTKKYGVVKQLGFQPKTSGYIFIAKKESGQRILVQNGKEIVTPYTYIHDRGYSEDGNSFAYVASADGKRIVNKDGKEYDEYFSGYDIEELYDVVFSKDLSAISFHYTSAADQKRHVVIWGKERILSQDGGIFGFVRSSSDDIFYNYSGGVAVFGTEKKEENTLFSPSFAPHPITNDKQFGFFGFLEEASQRYQIYAVCDR